MSQSSSGIPSPDGNGSNPGNQRGKKKKKRNKRANYSGSSFQGRTDAIKQHIHDVGPKSKDMFARTTREIAEHVARTYKGGGEFLNVMNPDKLAFVAALPPPDPDPNDRLAMEKWKLIIKRQEDEMNVRKEASKQVFAVILGQCSDTARDRITAQPHFESIQNGYDVIGLLKTIKASLCSGATNKKVVQSAQEAMEKLFSFKQGPKMTNARCLEAFKELMDMVDYYGAPLGQEDNRVDPMLQKIAAIKSRPTPDELAQAKAKAKDEFFAVLFIRHADKTRHGSLITDIENAQTRGSDQCPKTMPKAFDCLVNCKSTTKPVQHDAQEEGVSCFTEDRENQGGRGRGRGRGRGGGRGRGNGSGRGGHGNNANCMSNSENNSESDSEASEDADPEEPEAHVSESKTVDSKTTKAGKKECPASVHTIDHAEALVSEHSLPDDSILLDSCSSANIVSNPKLLHGMFDSPTMLPVRTLAGTICLDKKGCFGTHPEPMWHHPSGTVNILSLNEACECNHVTLNSEEDKAFYVHQDQGRSARFGAQGNGLFSHVPIGESVSDVLWPLVKKPSRKPKIKTRKPAKLNNQAHMIDTVAGNAKLCPKRSYQRAVRARKLQNIIMRPGARQLSDVAIKHLSNCPITKSDVAAAEHIFGPNLGALKGKTPRTAPEHVRANIDPVPPETLQVHEDVTLCIDMMFVNKIAFLITKSRNISFGTVDVLQNRRVRTMKNKIEEVVHLHTRRGFNVTTILADHEFEPLREHFPNLNTTAADEHVPDIERHIRTVKERTRGGYNMLPFRHLPRLVLIHLVRNSVSWLNALPAVDGVSTEHSPRHLMTGKELTYDRHVKMEFGQHVQVHEEHDNSMNPRTMSAICLGPTGNEQGGHWFFSLTSGARVVRCRWTMLPMPTDAMQRVSQIGRNEGMPSTMTYSNRRGEEIRDTIGDFEDDPDIDDDTHNPDDDDDSESDDDLCCDTDEESELSTHDADDPDDQSEDEDDDDDDNNDNNNNDQDEDDDDDDNDNDGDGNKDGDEDNNNSDPANKDNDPELPTHPSADDNQSVTPTIRSNQSFEFEYPVDDDVEQTGVGDNHEQTGVGDNIEQTGVETVEDDNDEDTFPTLWDEMQNAEKLGATAAETGEALPKRVRRPNPKHADGGTLVSDGISHLIASDMMSFVTIAEMNAIAPDQCFLASLVPHAKELHTFLTAQMTAKKGLKLFGKRGVDALMKELKQPLHMEVMHPVPAKSLTYEQKIAALKCLMFLKEKRSGVVKGRGCADGRKQRACKTKEETHAPTASTESVFLTSVVDAYEGRDVAIVDIPGAFMQSRIDELTHVKLEGELVDLMIRLDPSYRAHVTHEKGKKVICTELDKALHGTMQAALLFWQKLTRFLVKKGFKVNPCDKCVANKTIKGSQCTICWHVDDLKISHKSSNVVTKVIKMISAKFAKKAPLTIHRGKVFDDYLGMKMDFSTPGKVVFTMIDCIDRVLSETPKDLLKGPSKTPAANHLFRANDEATKLNEKDSETCHHLTAMMLCLAKRARPDMQTAMSFLCTRVQSPDTDDWKKLGRCLRCIKDTKSLPLTLEMDDSNAVRWWVDASFAVHPNMRSHAGATVALGKGSPCSMSTKQKLNTRSSTEAELVGVNDAMSFLWMDASGCPLISSMLSSSPD